MEKYTKLETMNMRKAVWAFRKVASGDKTIQIMTDKGKSTKPRPVNQWKGNHYGDVPLSIAREIIDITSEVATGDLHGTRQVFAAQDIPAGTLLMEVPVFMAHAAGSDGDLERINDSCLSARQNSTPAEDLEDIQAKLASDKVARIKKNRESILVAVWKMNGADGFKTAQAIIDGDESEYGAALTQEEYTKAEPKSAGTTDEAPDMPKVKVKKAASNK